VLSGIALGLDRRPQLVERLWSESPNDDGVGGKRRVNFVEDAANIVREAFIKCLSDKTGSAGIGGKDAAPQGKRIGIYKTANLCLKLLLHCRKLSSATTIFASIDAQSPPLSLYPAAQRVTYLYYLGRYLFATNHFYRAQLALQSAYDQCHAQAVRHRQLILVYLTASNICLGRFPSSKLLLRREGAPLAKHFLPLRRLVASGDLFRFRQYLSLDSPEGQWFLQKRLLLQLRNRCDLLVWRSLARRVFIEVGFPGGEDNKTPFLRLTSLQTAAQWLNRPGARPALNEAAADERSRKAPYQGEDYVQTVIASQTGSEDVVDSEFTGLDEAIAQTGFDPESGTYHRPDKAASSALKLNEVNGASFGQQTRPSIAEVESLMASLIQQDLITGFLTHNNPRFAIPGAKTRGPLAVGFPPVWEVIKARREEEEVPGWVKRTGRGQGTQG
jgi:nuclear mRNA export protein PCID2/THP1